MCAFGTAHANLIIDGGFNAGAPPNPPGYETVAPGNNTTIADWTVTGAGNGVTWASSSDYQAPVSGQYSVVFNGTSAAGISQSLATTVGTTYDVTFYLSGTPTSGTRTVDVTAGSVFQEDFSYTGTTSKANMNYQLESFSFTATTASTSLVFGGPAPGGPGTSVPVIGDVDVEPAAAVPLPPTLLFFAPGLLGLVGIRRRLKK